MNKNFMSVDFSKLEEKLDIKFNNRDLLLQALVHRSYLNENPDFHLNHNERLEFLGDAVLELVVTEYLYQNYPNSEGDLTVWRAALVNSKMLSEKALQFSLGEYILLSRGEAKDAGKARQCILANSFEALIGAIYLDQGPERVRRFVEEHLLSELQLILEKKAYRDSKSFFQEKAQDKAGITPSYEVLEEWGPDHAKQFRIGVYLEDELVAEGAGASKQEAQQKAAEEGLKKKNWQD